MILDDCVVSNVGGITNTPPARYSKIHKFRPGKANQVKYSCPSETKWSCPLPMERKQPNLGNFHRCLSISLAIAWGIFSTMLHSLPLPIGMMRGGCLFDPQRRQSTQEIPRMPQDDLVRFSQSSHTNNRVNTITSDRRSRENHFSSVPGVFAGGSGGITVAPFRDSCYLIGDSPARFCTRRWDLNIPIPSGNSIETNEPNTDFGGCKLDWCVADRTLPWNAVILGSFSVVPHECLREIYLYGKHYLFPRSICSSSILNPGLDALPDGLSSRSFPTPVNANRTSPHTNDVLLCDEHPSWASGGIEGEYFHSTDLKMFWLPKT